MDHGTAFGRIAFACPSSEVYQLEINFEIFVTKSVLVYMFKIAKHTIAAASYKHLSYTSVINYGNVTLPDFGILFYSSLTWRKR